MLGKNLMTLLGEFEVCIPMLQRDYAQGRRSQEHVARKFLDAIFKALESGEALHIDFVYGYRQDCKFILIDGQQRLTTLWLLHLYLYRKAGKLDAQSQKLFERFSYATRPSSAEFCRGLAREEFLGEGAPSAVIMDRSELFGEMGALKNDPTIKSMMHMLDLLDQEVGDRDVGTMVENLDKITFDFFDMGQFKLGEELYIKMNARGKQLSDYENLKAFVEKDLDISEESTKEVLKRIDTRWSDYFYPKKEEKLSLDERGARFDDRGRNFLHYGAMFFHFKEKLPAGKAEILEMLEHQNIDEFYGVLQSVENLTWLDRTLELFSLLAEYEKFQEMLAGVRLEFLGKPSFFDDEKKSQNHGFGRLSYKTTSYLFALMWYMQGHIVDEDDDTSLRGIDISSLADFLRVSKHLIENHRLDQPNFLVSFFELFRFLSGCVEHDSVYDFMASVPYKSKFHAEIYALEARKAELILRGRYDLDGKNNWEGVLDRTSNHPVLVGWIDHLLNFSSPSFKAHEPYKNKEYGDFDLERFQQYARLSMQILDASFLEKNLALLQRAWFSVGDYGLYSTNWFYGNCPSAGIRDREAWNWLISGKSDEKEPYFKRLLDRLITYGAHGASNEELRALMQKVIDDADVEGHGWWEQILIKQKGVFEFFEEYRHKAFQQACRIRFFEVGKAFSEDYFIEKAELLRGLRNTKDAVDLLGYGFYNYCLEEVGLDVGNLEVREFGGKKELRGLVFEIADDGMDYKVVVQCDGAESSIKIANNDPYPINLYEVEDIFEEFDAALESAGLA